MTAVAREVARLADAIETHNNHDRDEVLESELRAMREVPRMETAVRRGVLLTSVKSGLFAVVVPPAYWTQPEADVYTISCPCGSTPRLDGYLVPTTCEGEDCERTYVYDGTDVRVTNLGEPAAPPAAA